MLVLSIRIFCLHTVLCICLLTRLPAPAQPAVSLTPLVSLQGGLNWPQTPLLEGQDGNFYGTVPGMLFKMTPDGVLTPLHYFVYTNGYSDGGSPFASVVQSPDGNIYGVAKFGGPPRDWGGTIFQASTNGIFTNLFFFPDVIDAPNSALGYGPICLFLSSDGNFYGTTDGGKLPTTSGSVFKMTPDGAITVLWTFGGYDAHRVFSLVETGDGYLYGAAAVGSTNSMGAIIKIGRSPGSPTELAKFGDTGGTNGSGPEFLMMAADGNFYGRATYGGAYGQGAIFKMTPDGTLSAIHSFTASEGGRPVGLMQATDGNFYGATTGGLPSDYGAVFRLTPGGQFTVLHFFSAADACGNEPWGGFVQGSDGSFYGATCRGSTNGGGAIFKMTVTSAEAPWIQSVAPSTGGTLLKWLALKGRNYQVQSCADLLGNWTNVGLPVTAPSQFATALDENSSEGQRFYRVALLP